MLALKPKQIDSRGGHRLVDIRPADERDAGMGVVPGSIGLDPAADLERFVDEVNRISRGSPVVLVCLSGERARKWAIDTAASLVPDVGYLGGGVLAWGAEGLPLYGKDVPVEAEPMTTPEFRRTLVSCFVAELAEVALDRRVDPLQMLRACFEDAGADFDAPTRGDLRRVLDFAAVLSWQLGTSLDRIATNIDMMLPLLPTGS